jgi:hypothetical protein
VNENNIDPIKKYKETEMDAIREVGQEVKAGKIKYMFLSHHQNAG